MILNRYLLSAAVPFVLCCAASFASGQSTETVANESGGTISGRAVQNVKVWPTTARVYLQVSAKGKTLEAALENVKKRSDDIRSQVVKLGGKADTVKFSGLDKTDSTDRKQMLDTLRRQMGSDRLPKGLATPQSVTVNTTFSADWPLSANTPEKLLLESDQLKQKIIDADLAGVKAEAAQQTPEEREIAEEMQTMLRDRYSSGEVSQKPGTPTLVFVAHLSDANRETALAEAFKKARANAERLAKAAGARLGPLVRVNSISDSFNDQLARQRNEYNQMAYGMNQPWQPQIDMADNEASQHSAVEIEFPIGIEAVFTLRIARP